MADDKIRLSIELEEGSVKQSFSNIEKQAKASSKNIESSFGGVTSLLTKNLAAVGAGLAAIGTAYVGTIFSKASIEAAIEQEQAITRLNQSLASAGRFTQETSREFQEFAKQLGATTAMDAEVIDGLLALSNNFARTNEEAKKLTQSAIELSAATGKDLNSSIEMLGKTLSGEAGRLGSSVPAIKNLSAEALKAGEAIDIVLSRFSGSAAAQANTFQGSINTLKNAFEDVLEEVGKFVTQSPALIKLFQIIADGFRSAAESIGGFREGRDIIGDIIIISIKFAEVINQYLIAPIEIATRVVNAGFQAILVGASGLVAGVAKTLSFLVNQFPDVPMFAGIKASLASVSEAYTGTFVTQLGVATEAANTALNVDFAGSTALFLEDMRSKFEGAKAVVQDFKNNAVADLGAISYPLVNLGTSFEFMVQGAKDALDDLNRNASKNFANIGKQAVTGLGNAAGQAFAAFGKAMVEGKNGIEAFLNSLLASFGQMAVQMGTQFILQGLAYQLAGMPNGGPLMAAGAALATFGGVLGALGGGGGSSASGGGGAAPSSEPIATTPTETPIDLAESVQRPEATTTVAINIQGDVLDSDESGLRIVNILESAFDKQGVVIKRGIIA
jgi:hypothetical protein